MGDLRIIKTPSMFYVAEELKYLSINPVAIKEMGEPFIWVSGQQWIFAYDTGELCGFICHNSDTILYLYVQPKYRKTGIASRLYNEIPDQAWKTVASNGSLSFFTSRGFKTLKSFVNCHKLWKK